MKRSDLITIILVAGIGIIASYVLVNLFLGDPEEFSVSYKYIDEIAGTVTDPSTIDFNSEAINPTVEVYVGQCLDTDGDGTISALERSTCATGVTEKEEEAEEEEEPTEEAPSSDLTPDSLTGGSTGSGTNGSTSVSGSTSNSGASSSSSSANSSSSTSDSSSANSAGE